MSATAPPLWKTIVLDSLGFALTVWSIPLAILIVGTPIVLFAALVIALAGRFCG